MAGSAWPSTPACWPPWPRAGRVALVSGTNGKTTTTRLLVGRPGRRGERPGRHQRHRGQHARRPRGRPGRRPGAGPVPCSRSTRATWAGSSRRPDPGWWSSSTCRGTSSTGSPRCGCWSTGGGRPSGAGPPGSAGRIRRHGGGGQRRRPDGGVGGLRRARRALGGGRPGVAQRRGGLSGVRGRIDLRRRRGVGLRPVRLRPARTATPGWRGRTWSPPTGPRAPVGHRPAGPVQPGQRGHGGRGRPVDGRGRCPVGRRRPTALARLAAVDEVAGRFSASTCVRADRSGCCWPRTRPAGPPSSICWTRRGPTTARGALGQRPDRRRPRHQLAVGRALRAAGRPAGGGHRRPSARPGRAPPLRRGGPRRWWPTRWPPSTGALRHRGPPIERLPSDEHGGRPRDGHRLPRATTPPSPTLPEPAVSPGSGRRRRWPSPWSTPTCWAPTATAGTGWSWPAGRRGGGSTPTSSRPTSGRPLPTADIYCIGGGEDGPEVRAAEALRAGRHPRPGRRARRGGARGVRRIPAARRDSFPDSADRPHEGLGLLDVTTRKGTGRRAVGEVVAAHRRADAPRTPDGTPLPPLTGFENHGAVTTVGPGRQPVARVVPGRGQRRRRPDRGGLVAVGCSAPISTGRCWPATPPWPTCCSAGPCRTGEPDRLLDRSTTPRSSPSAPSGWRRSTPRRRTASAAHRSAGSAPESAAPAPPGPHVRRGRRCRRRRGLGAGEGGQQPRATPGRDVGPLERGSGPRPPPACGPSTSRSRPRWPWWPPPPRCAAEPAGVLVLVGPQRRAEGDGGPGPAEPRCPLGQDVAGPVEVDRHHRAAGAGGQVGGAAGEVLRPSVGRAPTLGEDDQVPAVGQQPGGQLGRPAVDLGPLDGDGGQQEGQGVGLPSPVEEVVGRRRHHRAVAEPQRAGSSTAGGCRRGWRGWPRRSPVPRDPVSPSSPRISGEATTRASGRATLSSTMARARRTGYRRDQAVS